MDISKFKIHDWLMVGGAAAFLIAGFLPWWQISGLGSNNAFDYFFTGTVTWLVFVAIGVLTFLAASGIFRLPETFPAPTVFLIAAAAATLLVIIRFFVDGVGVVSLDRGAGLFLALVAAIVVLVGAFLSFQDSGGNLAELGKSMQSKVSSGGSGSSNTAPPPPPPSDAPPPPPPPAN